jgi:hypothetical protein
MGILSNNSNLVVNSTSDGILTLSPSTGDSSVATISNVGTSTVSVKGLGSLGYVTLNNSNKLKIGNANLSITNDTCIAALVRIPDYDAFDALNGYVRLFETSQLNVGSVPRFSQNIRGGAYSTDTSKQRNIVTDVEQNNGSIGLSYFQSNRPFTGPGTSFNWPTWTEGFSPFGVTNVRRRYTGWIWIFTTRSTTNKDVTEHCLSINGSSLFRTGQQTGFVYADRILSQISTGEYAACISGAKVIGVSATDALQTISNVDFVLGGTTGTSQNIDIARMFKIDTTSVSTRTLMSLFRGMTPSECGLTLTSNDFFINFSSATSAGNNVTVASGTPVYNTNATDGPIITRDVATITSNASTNISITNGTVSI